jgi:phosphopantetheinyl transferase (holo-ACP synthase)
VAAKRAVAGALGLDDPTQVALVPVPAGAPLIELRDAKRSHRVVPCAVSLSHRAGRAAAAATTARGGLGVDLELTDQVGPAHAGYYLSPAERERAGVYSLTTLWTLKEAAWKALQCDATVPFTALQLEFDGSGAVVAVSLAGRTRPAVARLLGPWRGYVLAIVWLPGEER